MLGSVCIFDMDTAGHRSIGHMYTRLLRDSLVTGLERSGVLDGFYFPVLLFTLFLPLAPERARPFPKCSTATSYRQHIRFSPPPSPYFSFVLSVFFFSFFLSFCSSKHASVIFASLLREDTAWLPHSVRRLPRDAQRTPAANAVFFTLRGGARGRDVVFQPTENQAE